jgi:hypothetical protein
MHHLEKAPVFKKTALGKHKFQKVTIFVTDQKYAIFEHGNILFIEIICLGVTICPIYQIKIRFLA